MVRRLMLIPLVALIVIAVRIQSRPFCDLLDHDVVLDADGLMCRRCGHLLNR